MSTIQKICIIIGVCSLVVFYISIESSYVYSWGSVERMFAFDGPGIFDGNVIGLIAVFNIVASVLGFLLFKDK